MVSRVELSVNGTREVRQALANVRSRAPKILLDRELHDLANRVRRHARRTTRFRDRTGRLRRSIRIARAPRGVPSDLGYVVRAGNPYGVDYAPYIEFGTKHIRPRRFLRAAVRAIQPRALRLLSRGVRSRFPAAIRRVRR